MKIISKSFVKQSLDDLLGEWNDPYGARSVSEAEDLIDALQVALAELRKTPVYPEAAVKAVWWSGAHHGWDTCHESCLLTNRSYDAHAEEIARIFTEALQKGGKPQ